MALTPTRLPSLSQIDIVALDSRRLGPSRLGAAAVVVVLVGATLDWRRAAIWGAALAACEGWMWISTAPFARGRPVGRRHRLAYMGSAICGAGAWLTLSLFYWQDAQRGSQFLALLIWSALLLNAISFAFRSALALVLFAAPVSLVMLAAPLAAPKFDLREQLLADVGLVILVVYAAISARRNVKAASALDASRKALERARSTAEAANRAKSVFLATMSHEIRTPLNGVLGMAQAMAHDELPPAQRERLSVIDQSGNALLVLLNDLLDLSRIESGRLELEDGVIDLDELASGAQATFQALTLGKPVSMAATVAPEAHGLWRGDPTRVRQIIYNLVSNAAKFTAEGSVTLAVRREGERTVISVADTGPGIPAESLASLFNRFVQVDASTTRRYGGSGLGLAICRELAELMGGRIVVQSVVGQGSVFTLTLPMDRAQDDAATCAPPPIDSRSGAGLRVLAAEDDPVNQLVLKTLLGHVGIDVVIVGNGAEAVQANASDAWDLIFLDVHMPVMDGLATARAIRAAESAEGRRRTPIVALTANVAARRAPDYLAAGIDSVVAKPLQAPELIEVISSALKG